MRKTFSASYNPVVQLYYFGFSEMDSNNESISTLKKLMLDIKARDFILWTRVKVSQEQIWPLQRSYFNETQ